MFNIINWFENRIKWQLTSRSNLCDDVKTQATVPSPPATRTLTIFGASSIHHCKAAGGFLSLKSITCTGFKYFLNSDKTSAPSVLPDFLFAKIIVNIVHNFMK